MVASKQLRTVKDMQPGLSMPLAFLRRITQRLSTAGLLASSKGFKGGFSLVKDPRQIRLLDVIEIFQGSFKLNECLFKKGKNNA